MGRHCRCSAMVFHIANSLTASPPLCIYMLKILASRLLDQLEQYQYQSAQLVFQHQGYNLEAPKSFCEIIAMSDVGSFTGISGSSLAF
uniref:Uncharacterized protein n=1 Tax=Noccaea caerulescens TaxID=107243 RepID=A0A1J3F488_NOCCA